MHGQALSWRFNPRRFVEARDARQQSREQLGARIHYCYSQIRNIETGRYLPSVKFLQAAARGLRWDIRRFFDP